MSTTSIPKSFEGKRFDCTAQWVIPKESEKFPAEASLVITFILPDKEVARVIEEGNQRYAENALNLIPEIFAHEESSQPPPEGIYL